MKSEEVLSLYNLLEENGMQIIIDGGWSVDAYAGRFDLTMSCRLFDDYSSLVSEHEYRERRQTEVYRETFKALLDVTKRGGLGIHDGDAMKYAIGGNLDFCKVREVASPLNVDRSTFLIHVVQRI